MGVDVGVVVTGVLVGTGVFEPEAVGCGVRVPVGVLVEGVVGVLVDGVTGSMTALNGEQRVTAATATTLQFATAVADGTATGTITVKTAPAGWQKLYTGTNKAAFKSLAVESLGMLLRGWFGIDRKARSEVVQ